MKIIHAEEKHYNIIRNIAEVTWPVTFGHIISAKQIKYMLEMMYSIPSLTQQVKEKKHTFILAQENDEYFGYLSYEVNYKGQNKTKIHKIYILPTAQGKGVGKLLMNTAADAAIKNGNAFLSLNVNRENNAVKFYESQGFTVVGKEDIDIGEGFLMEDYIMEKPLG